MTSAEGIQRVPHQMYEPMDHGPQTPPSILQLLKAIRKERVKQVTALIQAGVDVNGRGRQGISALMQTVYVKREDVRTHTLRLLISNGADINVQDDFGRTALMIASFEKDRVDVVRRLIKTSLCDPNMVDNQGSTVLCHAVYGSNATVIRILVTSTHTKPILQVDRPNRDGHTPLVLAVKLCQKECCRVLVHEGGANTSAVKDKAALKAMLAEQMKGDQPNNHDAEIPGPSSDVRSVTENGRGLQRDVSERAESVQSVNSSLGQTGPSTMLTARQVDWGFDKEKVRKHKRKRAKRKHAFHYDDVDSITTPRNHRCGDLSEIRPTHDGRLSGIQTPTELSLRNPLHDTKSKLAPLPHVTIDQRFSIKEPLPMITRNPASLPEINMSTSIISSPRYPMDQ